jgi:uncharacterized delta-60 repeat protein
MFHEFLKAWPRNVRRLRRGRASATPLPGAQVQVESLEDRALPSAAPIVPTVTPPPDWVVFQQITAPDGKIIIVGSVTDATRSDGMYLSDFAVARYNADGTLDTSFGNGGLVVTAVNGGADVAYNVLVQPDGKILVVGHADPVITYPAPPLPFCPVSDPGMDGTASDGSTGDIPVLDVPSNDMPVWDGSSGNTPIAVDPTTDVPPAADPTADGSVPSDPGAPVTTCDGSVTDPTAPTDPGADASVPDPSGVSDPTTGGAALDNSSGDIVESGCTVGYILPAWDFAPEVVSPGGFALVRYNDDGSLDTTFGNGGMVVTTFAADLSGGQALAAAVQPDGGIVVAGTAPGIDANGDPNWNEFTVARYTADGTLDTTFGNAGSVQLSFGGADSADAVSIQPDGKILATGTSWQTSFTPYWIAIGPDGPIYPDYSPSYSLDVAVQLNPDGSLDSNFGTGGELITGQPPPPDTLELGDGSFVWADGGVDPGAWQSNVDNFGGVAPAGDGAVQATDSGNSSSAPSFSGPVQVPMPASFVETPAPQLPAVAQSVSQPPLATSSAGTSATTSVTDPRIAGAPLPNGTSPQTVVPSAPSTSGNVATPTPASTGSVTAPAAASPSNSAPLGNARLGIEQAPAPSTTPSDPGGVVKDGESVQLFEALSQPGDDAAAVRDDFFAQLPESDDRGDKGVVRLEGLAAAVAIVSLPGAASAMRKGSNRHRQPPSIPNQPAQ